MLAVYDLKVSPPTFDFVGFLVSAERERIKRGDDHISIVIAAGPEGGFRKDNLPPRDPALRRKMLETIVIPMCGLLPSVASVNEVACDISEKDISKADFPIGWTPHSRIPHYGTHHIISAIKAGCYPLTAGERLRDDFLITITLRQAPHWPTRNSNFENWHKAAVEFQRMGYDIVIIPDEGTINVPGHLQSQYGPKAGFFYDVEAMYDLKRRASLYERARLNLFVNGGPHAMCLLMRDTKSICFKMTAPGAPCVDPNFWKGAGLPVGTQTGKPGSRIVWADDETQTIVNEVLIELALEEAA